MENMGTGEWIVIGLSLIVGLFFVIGNWVNNQRANESMRWLRQGLAGYGELKSSYFNAPSSKGIPFQITPSERCPYQHIQGKLVLERRENLPLWAYQRIRGKRDILQWTSDLQEAPTRDGHFDQKSFLTQVNTGNAEYKGDAEHKSELPALNLDIAVQRKSPHLTFEVQLSPLLRADPQSFFQTLKKGIEGN